ncbi:MAG: ATP-binding protein [Ferruginibacter sp.]
MKKIVVIGPESTGKSTLCTQLAAHFRTEWVREYAREYLEENGTAYRFEDLSTIATGQIELEEKTAELLIAIDPNSAAPPYLFIDTDLYVIKIWSEFVFNKIDNSILNKITKRKYDLYLLCDTDLPWVEDELREYPDPAVRKKLFKHYKEEMTEQSVPWVIIRGNFEERLAAAIRACNKLL